MGQRFCSWMSISQSPCLSSSFFLHGVHGVWAGAGCAHRQTWASASALACSSASRAKGTEWGGRDRGGSELMWPAQLSPVRENADSVLWDGDPEPKRSRRRMKGLLSGKSAKLFFSVKIQIFQEKKSFPSRSGHAMPLVQ